MLTVEEIYQRYIKNLSEEEKLRLIVLITNDLIESETEDVKQKSRKFNEPNP